MCLALPCSYRGISLSLFLLDTIHTNSLSMFSFEKSTRKRGHGMKKESVSMSSWSVKCQNVKKPVREIMRFLCKFLETVKSFSLQNPWTVGENFHKIYRKTLHFFTREEEAKHSERSSLFFFDTSILWLNELRFRNRDQFQMKNLPFSSVKKCHNSSWKWKSGARQFFGSQHRHSNFLVMNSYSKPSNPDHEAPTRRNSRAAKS